jgi:transcriptional regulator with XRE-family HTH domain
MTTNSKSGHPQTKNTRPHDSKQPPSSTGCARFEDENARARALVNNDNPEPHEIGTVRDKKSRAGALVNKNDDTIIRTQPGYVIGDEQEFLANGFGAMLRNMRTTQGLTQDRLKALAGVTKPYISLLERGLRRPTPDVIKALAQALVPEDQQDYLIERLTEAAGDSIRESWARQQHRAKARRTLRDIAELRKHDIPKLQSQINKLHHRGSTEAAYQLEDLLEKMNRQMDSQEAAAKADLAALGDDPDQPIEVRPRRAPRHFRKRSYGLD